MPYVENPKPDDPIRRCIVLPHPRAELTDRYEQVETAHLTDVAFFRVVHPPRGASQTEKQWQASRLSNEKYYFTLSVLRHLAHMAADELDFPATCAQRRCRRARACLSDREEFDWSFPGPWMPPCATTYRLVDLVRASVREELKR